MNSTPKTAHAQKQRRNHLCNSNPAAAAGKSRQKAVESHHRSSKHATALWKHMKKMVSSHYRSSEHATALWKSMKTRVSSRHCSSAQHRNFISAVMIASSCNLLLRIVGSASVIAFQIQEFDMQMNRNAVNQKDSNTRRGFRRCQRVATLMDFYV